MKTIALLSVSLAATLMTLLSAASAQAILRTWVSYGRKLVTA
jgi:hypothetical protein